MWEIEQISIYDETTGEKIPEISLHGIIGGADCADRNRLLYVLG